MNDRNLDVSKTTFKLVYASSDGGGGVMNNRETAEEFTKSDKFCKSEATDNSANSCYGF